MADVRARAEPVSIFMDVDDEERSIFHNYSKSFNQDIDDVEHEPLSQPWVNYPTATTFPEEFSQVPASLPVAFSPQPSTEFLASLGIKVRDFAYENTLPAIVPVPRVPRQVQPAPRMLKRLQREWDEEGEGLKNLSPISGTTPFKKSRSLERKPTEPLEEIATRVSRTLERIALHGGDPIITSPTRRTPSPPAPRRPISTSPPTSPLTPQLSHLASQDSEFVRTPSAFPFAVHVDDTEMIPARELGPVLQAATIHPVLFTSFPSDSHPAPIITSHNCSPLRLPRDVSPSHLVDPFLEPPPPIKGPGRDRSAHGTSPVTPPPIRYQLRQRPILSSHTSSSSRCSRPQSRTSKSLPRRK